VIRPGQAEAEFQVDAVDGKADQATITARLGGNVAADTITFAPDDSTRIRVPGDQFVKYGNEVRFRISASDPTAMLSAGVLPDRATFDATAGELHWTPDVTQLGAHTVDFIGIGANGVKVKASVNIQVDSGEPVVTAVVNAASRSSKLACSPGALASVQGRWLIEGPTAADPSRVSDEFARTRLLVNGVTVPILAGSASELTFLCPDVAPGSDLEVVVQNGHGITAPVRTTVQVSAPGIFSINGSGEGQGAVVLDDGHSLAMVRNHQFEALPAIPGDHVVVYATGLDRLTNFQVELGAVSVKPDSVATLADHPGVFEVKITVPHDVTPSNAVRLLLSGDTTDGSRVVTNSVEIAVEGKTI
jgi:uncharacterized protein (TIGR03437 family)